MHKIDVNPTVMVMSLFLLLALDHNRNCLDVSLIKLTAAVKSAMFCEEKTVSSFRLNQQSYTYCNTSIGRTEVANCIYDTMKADASSCVI